MTEKLTWIVLVFFTFFSLVSCASAQRQLAPSGPAEPIEEEEIVTIVTTNEVQKPTNAVVKKTNVVPKPRVIKVPSVNAVYFAFNESKIASSYDEGGSNAGVFTNILNYLKASKNIAVTLMGYTDSFGSEEYNLELGLRRANSVANHLVENGIDKSKITTKSLGEKNLLISGSESIANQWKNRRVEFDYSPYP